MASDPQGLIEPFEWVLEDGPRKGTVTRPVVYLFQHVMLREAFFRRHPLLAASLRGEPDVPVPFGRLWIETLMACERRDLRQPGSAMGFAGFWNYVAPMAYAIQVRSIETDRHKVWILSMPAPKASPDCHFIALCEPRSEAEEDLRSERFDAGRYLTLEHGGEHGSAYFCSWASSGMHANLGHQTDVTAEHFEALVVAALAG